MTGNLSSSPDNPLFLLDESLTPVVAEALAIVGYNFVTAEAVLGRRGAKDPEIIEWCRENNAVWIHADDRARKQHRKLLQTSGIRTLWLYRKRGRMTGKEQLRILAFVLPQLIETFKHQGAARHFRATAASPVARPGLRTLEI